MVAALPCQDFHVACVRRGAVEDLRCEHNSAHLLTEKGILLRIRASLTSCHCHDEKQFPATVASYSNNAASL